MRTSYLPVRLAAYTPRGRARAGAMAKGVLHDMLRRRGLWVASVERGNSEAGLETAADLRCCLNNAEQAAGEGGLMLRLAWELASGIESVDSTHAIQQVRKGLQEDAQLRRALHVRPSLPPPFNQPTDVLPGSSSVDRCPDWWASIAPWSPKMPTVW